jgi:hypothetical protein
MRVPLLRLSPQGSILPARRLLMGSGLKIWKNSGKYREKIVDTPGQVLYNV